MASILSQMRRASRVPAEQHLAEQHTDGDCKKETDVVSHDSQHTTRGQSLSTHAIEKRKAHSTYPISARTNSNKALIPSLLTLQGALATQKVRDLAGELALAPSSACCGCIGLKGSFSWPSTSSSLTGFCRKARLHCRVCPRPPPW